MSMRKTLFLTPVTKDSEEIDALLNKIQVDLEVENNLNHVSKELHEQRIAKMKQILEDAKQDEWKYAKIEDLIGF